MNKNILIVGGLMVLGLMGSLFFADHLSTVSKPNIKTANTVVLQKITPQNNAKVTTSQSPEDVIAGLYPNPIQNTSTIQGFKIASAMVENNTGSSVNSVSDHLQIVLQNLTNKDLTNFEVYYTITDSVTHQKEGYYKILNNYVLKAGATQSVNFDNKQGVGHFGVNINNLYFKSTDQLQFNIIVSAKGYKIQTATATKSTGGAETKD